MRPASKAFETPSPVLLSSGCSVASGSIATPNMTELAYPFRKPVLIDEIRFDLYRDDPGGSESKFVNLGALVYVKLQLGQHYLMRDFVPIWLLGTLMTLEEEQGVDAYAATPVLVSHYRWHLPEPLYVEAGQTLVPVFSSVPNAFASTAAINAQVSYAGRVVPPQTKRPSKIVVPYAAPFVTTFGNTYQQSNEYNLFNPFSAPIKVQRLTGRVLFYDDFALSLGAAPGYTEPPATLTAGATLLIDDSWGGKVVNNYTGVGDVFDALRAAWTVDTVMPAKGQYNVRVWNIPAHTQVHIGMIGSREEAL